MILGTRDDAGLAGCEKTFISDAKFPFVAVDARHIY